MENVRRVHRDQVPPADACCRCQEPTKRWDRIAGKAYCPNCEEDLVLGFGEPLCEPTEPWRCAACARVGTVAYLTFPLGGATPVEFDLCAIHLRALLGRCLPPHSFRQLRRRLHSVGLDVEHIFLLHDTFYDADGQALQPALGEAVE